MCGNSINDLYLYVGEHAAEASAKRTRYALPRPCHHLHADAHRHVRRHLQRGRCAVVPDHRPQHRACRHEQPHRRRARRGDDGGGECRGAAAVRVGAVDERAALAVGLSDVSTQDARARPWRRRGAIPAGGRSFSARLCVLPAARGRGAASAAQQRAAAAARGAHAPRHSSHRFESLEQDELHGFIDRLQLSLARTNDELARIYFVGHSAPSSAIMPIRVA